MQSDSSGAHRRVAITAGRYDVGGSTGSDMTPFAHITSVPAMTKPADVEISVSAVPATPALAWLPVRSTARRVGRESGKWSSSSPGPGRPGLKAVMSAGGAAA